MDQPPAAFDLSVDRDDDLPLATQLAWKLKALIASGHLGPGARLPGVRDLAEHGRGTFVAERSGEGELGRLAASAAAQAQSAGLDRRELAAALYGASDLALPGPAS